MIETFYHLRYSLLKKENNKLQFLLRNLVEMEVEKLGGGGIPELL